MIEPMLYGHTSVLKKIHFLNTVRYCKAGGTNSTVLYECSKLVVTTDG